ncbi:MAG TPA: hypothetical protein VNH65_06910 [Candidatus Acidoferrum sp.]|nr:hypothetical protein [Candidatus Acidoferrum sp.]
MKVSGISAILLGGSLLFSVTVFAGNTNKKSLHLYERVTIQGKQLTPGDYKFEWSGSGPEVKVDILKGRETVATVPARIVPQGATNQQDGYALNTGKNGSQTLAQLFFSGQNYDLNIGKAPHANASQSANSNGTN